MKRTLLVAGGVAAAMTLCPAIAQADPSPVSPLTSGPMAKGALQQALTKKVTARPSQTLATGLLTPLSVAMAPKGEVYFSQNFAGTLNSVGQDHTVRTVYRAQGEVGAISVRGNRVTFAVTAQTATLRRLVGGKVATVANLSAYEAKNNPDGKFTYGFPGLTTSCAKQFPQDFPVSNRGGNDNSHPYATYYDGHDTYVADAGANAIWKVSDAGKISTVAVLPPVPQKVTAGDIAGTGLPSCVVGKTYLAEAVPTGITMSPKGQLLVSSLPGGLERGGAVWQINPRNGSKKKIASGLNGGMTSISVSPNGQIYLAAIFSGQVLRLPACGGKPVVLQQVSMPGAVAWTPRGLLVTSDALVGAGDPESGQPSTEAPGGKVLLYGLYPGKKCTHVAGGGIAAMCRM